MTPAVEDNHDFKSGFVTLAGAPNVGKSTLLNRMLGEKISITSQKPQTTRNRILGILHRPRSQLIFLDTPGIHRAKGPLNQRIVKTATGAFTEVDLVLVIVDASCPDPQSEKILRSTLKKTKTPAILAINKIDLVERKEMLLQLIDRWTSVHPFQEAVPICAKDGTQVDALIRAMEARLPAGPRFFPADSLTDMPLRFIAAEMIREKVFRFTGQEIPYACAVTVEQFHGAETGGTTDIYATIFVERVSQKGIVIGKGGARLKQIGQEARRDIEHLLAGRVFLKLFVKVQQNWRRDTKALQRFGY